MGCFLVFGTGDVWGLLGQFASLGVGRCDVVGGLWNPVTDNSLEIRPPCAYTVGVTDIPPLELFAEHYGQRFSQRCSGPLRCGCYR